MASAASTSTSAPSNHSTTADASNDANTLYVNQYTNEPPIDLFTDFTTTTGLDSLMDVTGGAYGDMTAATFFDPASFMQASTTTPMDLDEFNVEPGHQVLLETTGAGASIALAESVQHSLHEPAASGPQPPVPATFTPSASQLPLPQASPSIGTQDGQHTLETPPAAPAVPVTTASSSTATTTAATTAPITTVPITAATIAPTAAPTTTVKSENAPNARKRIPPETTLILETSFQNNPKPDRDGRDSLAKQTGLPIRNIQVS